MKRINPLVLLLAGILYSSAGIAQQRCESVYLQIHSQWLMAGDTLSAGVMVTDPCESRLSELSDMVYVELWADEATPVFRTRVMTEGGTGTVIIPLDSSLPSGYYLLRAYTRYMRNFPEYQFFRHWIQVYQPAKPPALIEDGEVVFPLRALVNSCGPLLIDQPCKVLVSVDDLQGAPASTDIRLEDSEGKEVKAIVTDSIDLFVYEFVPKEGDSYRFQVKTTEERWTTIPLPEPTDRGIRLQLRTSGPDPLIEVISGRSNREPNLDMILLQAGIEYDRQTLFVRPGATVTIPLAQVARAGVSDIWLTKAEGGEIEASVSVCFPKSTATSSTASVITEEEAGDLSGKAWSGVPCLATYSNVHMQGVSLQSYLEWERGIPGYIPSHHPDEAIVWIDQWTPLTKEDLQLEDQRKFLSERGQIILEGKVEIEGKPVAEEVYFAVPGDPSWTRRTISDSTGYFRIELEHIVGQPDQVIFRSPDPKAEISLLPAFAPSPRVEFWPTLVLEEYAYDQLLTSYQYRQIHDKFLTEGQEIIQDQSPALTAASYGNPNKVYRFADYTRMPTEEAFIEFIPEAYLRKRNRQKEIFLLNTQTDNLFGEQPLLLIDGVPVFSSESILSTNYRLVDRIELVTEPYFLNGRVYSGVLNLITFQKDASTIDLNPGELRAELLLTPAQSSSSYRLIDGDRVPDVSSPGSVRAFAGELNLNMLPRQGTDRKGATEIWIQGLSADGDILEAKIPGSQP